MTPHKHTKTTPDVPITTTSSAATSPVVTPVATPSTTTTSAASTTPWTLVLSETPPVLNIPGPPLAFQSVKLEDYRGYYPKTALLAAVPKVTAEISSSTTYVVTFGPAMPEATSFVQMLDNAVNWMTLKNQVAALLAYLRSQEAVSWKAAILQIDQARAVYDVTLAKNPELPVLFPGLTQLVSGVKVTGQKAAATRRRNVAAEAKKATAATAPSTSTAAPSATSPSTTTSTTANGGAAH